MEKIAVVLFNLGGPDRPADVRPFLFKLFNDQAIIGLPQPLRWLLALLIALRRAPLARQIYAEIGGKSPLLDLTRRQAAALQARLAGGREDIRQFRVFTAMRYWHPLSAEVAREVRQFGPDRIVLLPLYPQFSTTTTGSSLAAWRRAAAATGLTAPASAVCCYPAQEGWIAAQARQVRAALVDQGTPEGTTAAMRYLFSAHGLPQKVIAAGDPYQWQVEQTARALAGRLGLADGSWRICYQSRVGPLAWIGPALADELAAAAADKVGVVVVPIAFVSEHSETLVELDIEYRRQAEKLGIGRYVRVPAVGESEEFIAALGDLALAALDRARRSGDDLDSGRGGRQCPEACGRCALA